MCRSICDGQLTRDPWAQCPLPRLLPGLTDPIVRAWRDALPPNGLHVVDASAYLLQPEAFLSDTFAFLGVHALSQAAMRAVVALPTLASSHRTNDDAPWRAVHDQRPFANTSEFLAGWYHSNSNRSGCWDQTGKYP